MAYLADFCGIYTITNLINNKIYVGYAIKIQERLNTHKSELINNKHANNFLQNSWNKYGIDNFKFELLEEYPEEFLPSMENYWCNLLNTHNPNYGYNLRSTNPKGNAGKLSKEVLYKRTETRRKNAEERGYWVSPERINKLKETKKGKPCDSKMVSNSIAKTSKPVNQLDLNGNIINTFKSISEAGRICNINSKTINSVCLGKGKTFKGFKWEYANK